MRPHRFTTAKAAPPRPHGSGASSAHEVDPLVELRGPTAPSMRHARGALWAPESSMSAPSRIGSAFHRLHKRRKAQQNEAPKWQFSVDATVTRR